MTISAKVICDSIGDKYSARLTTMQLRYPRFIHAEFMTHRVFSRNAASSRAIPAKTFRKNVMTDPAIPIHWGKNKPGMQAREELSPVKKFVCRTLWLMLMYGAVFTNWLLEKAGLHKQVANRILEPWMHIEVVVTSTDWANFFALRNHPDAQPEIQELARKMQEAQNTSVPSVLKPDEWHLPYILDEEKRIIPQNLLSKVSAARCARVSYLKHDGKKASVPEDLDLFEKLVGGNPKHASPTEHQARLPYALEAIPLSNLRWWHQFRKMIPGENIRDVA